MGRNCITALWIGLTFIFTVAIIFAMISPVWFEGAAISEEKDGNGYEIVTFGVIRYCSRYDLSDVIKNCRFFESFEEMPSIGWMISTIVYALGLLCFAVSVVLCIVILCTSEELAERLKIVSAYIQGVGVGFLAISVLMFPIGLDSQFAKNICGSRSTIFVAGGCQVAWGYVLSIMSVALTIFCPILAKYSTDVKVEDDDEFTDFEYKSECISLTTSSSSKVMTTV